LSWCSCRSRPWAGYHSWQRSPRCRLSQALRRRRGLNEFYDINIFPAHLANALGDQAMVAALFERDPWLVGFTCYVWNIERTLWIAHQLKRHRPGVRIVLGGPEITPDNDWVLGTRDYDFAVIGEGEQDLCPAVARSAR